QANEFQSGTPQTNVASLRRPAVVTLSAVPFRGPAGRRDQAAVLAIEGTDGLHVMIGELEFEGAEIAQAIFEFGSHREHDDALMNDPPQRHFGWRTAKLASDL